MSDYKTSVRLTEDEADHFLAWCAIEGRKPYRLAADLVIQAMNTALEQDPELASVIRGMVESRRAHRATEASVVATRAGFRLIKGGPQ